MHSAARDGVQVPCYLGESSAIKDALFCTIPLKMGRVFAGQMRPQMLIAELFGFLSLSFSSPNLL